VPERVAFITGITGQDGSYLAELLLEKGYTVHGLIRRTSSFGTTRLEHLYHDPHEASRLRLQYGDVTDPQALTNLVLELAPSEIYNLAAQSHVRVSFDQPAYTLATAGAGALHVLEAARLLAARQPGRFYQASSSEMFGKTAEQPQRETTPLNPQSPYACAKAFAHHQTINYRRSYGLFAVSGILFNHESPRRGETFVTRKITRAATRIKLGLQPKLYLGNLDAERDWGFAKDYVVAMWQMLQQHTAEDYVIATGETHTIRYFLEQAFGLLDLDWQEFVEIDPHYFRPAEVDRLVGDAAKARAAFGWQPTTSLSELVRLMVEHDLDLAERELHNAAFVGK
jgi:GDPmannose 4,6-dehydratase